MLSTGELLRNGSENIVTNLPGCDNNIASVTANEYPTLYFQAFSTGAPSPNLHGADICAKLLLGCTTNTLDRAISAPLPVTVPVLFNTFSTGAA